MLRRSLFKKKIPQYQIDLVRISSVKHMKVYYTTGKKIISMLALNCKTVVFFANASDAGGFGTKGLERV